VANQHVARLFVNITGRCSYLFIAIRPNVFHKKIEDAGFPLQQSQKLQGAVRGFDFRCGRWFWRWRYGRRPCAEPEFRRHVVGQFALKEEREEGAKSEYKTMH